MPWTNRAALLMLPLALLSAACSDPWLVVSPGRADAFKGQTTFMFDSVSLADAKVDGGTEEEYVATGDDLVELWQRGKKTFVQRFPEALIARLGERGVRIGPGPTIRARVEDIVVSELYTVDDNPNYLRTKIALVVSIADGDTVSDEVRIEQSAHGFATKPVELRFGAIGDNLGRITADFVASRVK